MHECNIHLPFQKYEGYDVLRMHGSIQSPESVLVHPHNYRVSAHVAKVWHAHSLRVCHRNIKGCLPARVVQQFPVKESISGMKLMQAESNSKHIHYDDSGCFKRARVIPSCSFTIPSSADQ